MNNTYYLKHHGIKGQKWGVRNGPPYPIEDKVLKKGTRVNSVSGTFSKTDKYLNSGRPIYAYRPDDEWDTKVYRGPFAREILEDRGAHFIRDHEFETVEDLRMADSKERFSEFKKILDDERTRETAIKDLAKRQASMKKSNLTSDPSWVEATSLDLNNLKTAKDYRIAYDMFNELMAYAHEYETTRTYIKNMAKKYDAMVDDFDVNLYNDAHDPIIFLKPAKFLRDVSDPKNPKFLTWEDTSSYRRELESDWLRREKNGEKIKGFMSF